jgi:hypothetical protein
MRSISLILVVTGIAGAAFSFLGLSGAALPYQDATAEMLAQQSESIWYWELSLLTNLFLLIIGSWGLWRTGRKH